MSDERAEVSVGATIDDAVAAIAQLTDQFAKFAKETTEHLDSVSQALGGLGEKVLGALEAFASIEGIEHAIDATREYAREVEQMAQKLGTGASEASDFVIALGDIGVSAEAAGGIMQRLQRQLKSNEGGLNALGLKTRDSSGQFLELNAIFQGAVEVLKGYKEGTDRNQVAMQLFGGRVGDLSRIMKYSSEVQEEARQKAAALGLTMTKESVAGAEGFRKALNDVHDVMLGLYKVIGDAVMPVLSSVIENFADYGPGAVAAFAVAIKTLVSAFDLLWLMLQGILNLITLIVRDFATFTATIARMVTSGPKAWGEIWKEGLNLMGQEFDDFQKKQLEHLDDFNKRAAARWGDGTKVPKPTGGKDALDPKAKEVEAAQMDEARKLAQQGLAMEEEFLKQEVEAKRLTEELKASIVREAQSSVYEFERATLEKKAALYDSDKVKFQQVQAELADLAAKHSLEMLKTDGDEARAKEKDRLKELQEQHTLDDAVTKLVDKGIKDRAALESSAITARLAMTDAGYKREVAYLDQLVQTGQITATRKLEIERTLLDSVYEAKRAELAKERDIAQTTEAETVKQRQEVDQKLAALDAQHQLDLQNNTNATLKALGEKWKQFFDAIGSAFGTTLKGMILGTTTWQQGMRNIGQSVLGEFVNLSLKLAEEWALAELKKTAATLLGVTERQVAEEAGSAAGLASMAAGILKAIGNYAAQTFAGVWAALSGIPIVGPALAAAAAPAALATVLAIGAGVSATAAGGYDVPAGVSPVTQLHPEEMVLPEDLANTVRSLARGGGGGSGGPVVQVRAMDSRDVIRSLRKGGALERSLRKLSRDHAVTGGR